MVVKTMEYVLDPNVSYYKYFEDMTRIPHGSYHEKAYSDYLVNWARERGLKCTQDELYNVIICKPASPGYEDRPAVILQAHMDMVCVRTPDSNHDFEKEPLQLYVEDGWLRARDTTLGADDGVGCAYMLAILDSGDIAHPPLQCVFTTQEEVGCNGAAALKPEQFYAKRMIGLDDVGGGTSYVTTAGARISRIEREVVWLPTGGEPAYRMEVGGLLSGHSGADIEKERGNAIKIAAAILFQLQKKGSVQLCQVNMGAADNAIPATGTVVFTSSMAPGQVAEIVTEYTEIFRWQLRESDPGLEIHLTDCRAERKMSQQDSKELITFLYVLPNGFRHKSMKLKDLTIASSNLGTWEIQGDKVVFTHNMRSAMDSYLDLMEDELEVLCGLFHLRRQVTARVTGFSYIEHSPLRKALDQAFFEVTGRHIQELFVHGGIEAGSFSRLVPGMDIVTIGPLVLEEHTVNERLNLQSFDDIWKTLLKLLASL